MASEITIRATLQILKDNTNFQSRPGAFVADMIGDRGPTPGATMIGTSHTVINLSDLVQPGWAFIENLDQVNFVEIGILGFGQFLPFSELLPGEFEVIRLSRWLGLELETGTGTGTGAVGLVQLAAKADIAPVQLLVHAFDR